MAAPQARDRTGAVSTQRADRALALRSDGVGAPAELVPACRALARRDRSLFPIDRFGAAVAHERRGDLDVSRKSRAFSTSQSTMSAAGGRAL
jgi:hypothetical protein